MAKNDKATAFGGKLRALREVAGLTQAELGEQSEMDSNAIARIERGEREPTWRTVLKLAKALGVKPDAFTTDEELS